MICKRNSDNRYFNYEISKDDFIEIWDHGYPKFYEKIDYNKWKKEYTEIKELNFRNN